jgi:hypothetical protein
MPIASLLRPGGLFCGFVITTNGPLRFNGCKGKFWNLGRESSRLELSPGVGKGSIGRIVVKFGGSRMSPPISNSSLFSAFSFRRRSFLPQKKSKTPIRKTAETPDATDNPTTAGELKAEDDGVGDEVARANGTD